ncbi:serine/threonine-protein kinase ssp1 [Ophiocordyceps camponoti-floridani]|uniref:non-specific serine/threonine protein kinase n=1 Tax=Ophiocordyceps camponoti-floridani TaxID=2030778 RepID=A0A8H4Q8V9_9HYPO|nr:serine/threonine-protein kinase ssp1 [Ophiocordyceps camponoti-floridani]
MDSSHLHHALSLHANAMVPSSALPLRTASSTPMSSPGLFSSSPSRQQQPTSVSESNTPAPAAGSPYLHPLQNHRVRETHKALIDSDVITGRKSINQYEVIEEIGRGNHGKVKLARNTHTGDNVAIKIIPRFSKKRRLGRVTALSPQDKTKREIAILKKMRHPNVVALLEVIDDPELKKIYMVLEHVELGEVVWRKKGLPHICLYERRRVERETRGDDPTPEEELYDQMLERRQAIKELKRARLAQNYAGPSDYWSVEHGAAEEGRWSRIPSREDVAVMDRTTPSPRVSRPSSRAPSRSLSLSSTLAPHPAATPPPLLADLECPLSTTTTADLETPIAPQMAPSAAFESALHYSSASFRARSSSVADSIISHMSSIDFNPRAFDPFAEDFSFVPCFTLDQARSTFRDTVLGLEYLHYQGVVHRDIKPANLLWTRDHRVKISDFGVSYFGRPIRDGEMDDTVSESEAKDFDDDLELAKTVGTPAFFAPELCYTDIDSAEQPKVSEQIDVWSLGVTLYCLIYARIPFLAEDEFQMFRSIANEEVHISRKRLKPVDPSTSPSATSLYKRQNAHPYRDDNDLEYEEVDNLLYDLLRQMLVKNPEKRIRLRDIKRHPWVVQGIANPVGWLDDTDPARPSCGRKIQVDEKDMSFAVVPLNFIERARSVVKKAVGKVIHPLVDRSESRSRRRAASSAASAASSTCGDSVFRNTGPPTQYTNDRRGSLRFSDFPSLSSPANAKEGPDFLAPPLSDTTPGAGTAAGADYDPLATVLPLREGPAAEGTERNGRPGHSQSWSTSLLQLMSPTSEARQRDQEYAGRGSPDSDTMADDYMRSAASADRSLFSSADKRAQAQVTVNHAMAAGSIQGTRRLKSVRSIDMKRAQYGYSSTTPSPLSSSPHTATTAAYQHGQPQSAPNFQARQPIRVDERPRTVHRVENAPDSRRVDHCDPDSPPTRDVPWHPNGHDADAALASYPPSPGARTWTCHSRDNTMTTVKSSSMESMEAICSPLSSPDEAAAKDVTTKSTAAHKMLNFQSDPSLPALLSGASSVSADMEGELLGRPGVVNGSHSPRLDAEDPMTASPVKAPLHGLSLEHVFENPPAMESGPLALHLHTAGPGAAPNPTDESRLDRDDGDEGSDDGILLMAQSRKRSPHVSKAVPARPVEAKRRDTGASTASTETAKRVPFYDMGN